MPEQSVLEAAATADKPVTPNPTPVPDPTPEPKGGVGVTKTFKVNGQEIVKSEAEAQEAAQKFFAGEDKLREAATLRTQILEEQAELTADAKVGRLMKTVRQTQDLTKFEELLGALGSPDDEIKTIVDGVKAMQEPSPLKQAADGYRETATPKAEGVTKDQLVEAVQTLAANQETLQAENKETKGLLEYFQNKDRGSIRDETKQEVFQAVDKDEILGKVVGKAGPRSQRLREMAWEFVLEETRLTKSYGPEALRKALDKTRVVAKDLGILDSTRTIPGAGPTAGLGIEVDLDKPPEIKPLTDPLVGDNITEQLAHFMLTHGDEET